MKKVLSLILAIVMVALLVPASIVTAEDVAVKAGNKNDNMVVTDGVYTVANDGKWGVYVLGESTNWEVTMTMHSEAANAEYGLQICGKDNDGDGVLLCDDGYGDSFLQVFNTSQNEVQLIGCENGVWGGSTTPGYTWGAKARFTGVNWGNDLTWTIKLNGNQLSYWVDGQQCGETIVLDEGVMYGNVVTLLMKHTDTSISNVTFVDHNAVVEPEEPVVPEVVEVAVPTVIDATGGAAGENKGGAVATVSKKYFAVSYTMTASSLAGDSADNGCCGLYFGAEDDCVYIPYDAGTTGTQRNLGIWGGANLVFGNWWGAAKNFEGTAATAITPDTEVTVLVLGVKGDDGKTTVSAYLNGEQINVWGKNLTQTGEFNGYIGWNTKLAGQKATVKFVESNTAIDKDVFDKAVIKVVSNTVNCTDREVTLDVMIEYNPGINTITFSPKADNGGITFVKAQKGDLFDGLTPGMSPLFDTSEFGNVTENGLVAKLVFEIGEDVGVGSYRVDLNAISAVDWDVEDVLCVVEAGYITVAHGDGKEVVDAKYLKSDATCSQKAVYYKSCECGAQLEETFEAGELLAHTFVENATEDYLNTPATCNKAATYFESCSVCGAKGEKTFEDGEPTGEHNYTDEWKHDENKHWHECGCGAKSDEADHDFGEGVVTTEPTTDAEGVKTFTCVCGATKTESIEKLPTEAPKTGTTTALAVAVALLTASTGAAVVITRKKRSI